MREIPARRARVPTSKPWTAQRIRPPPESVFHEAQIEIYKVGIAGPGIQTSSVTQKALLAKVCEHRTLSPWWAVFSCLILWRVRSLCLVAFNWSSLVWSGRSASNLLTGLLRVSPTVLAQGADKPLNWSSQGVTVTVLAQGQTNQPHSSKVSTSAFRSLQNQRSKNLDCGLAFSALVCHTPDVNNVCSCVH